MNIKNISLLNRRQNYIILLQAVLILFMLGFYNYSNILIIGLTIYRFTESDYLVLLKSVFLNKIVWALSSLFILSILGMLWTQDFRTGWKLIEMRLLFLVLPVLFYSLRLSSNEKNKILLTFILLNVLVALIGFGTALENYINTGDSNYFYNDYLVYAVGGQAVYYSIFNNLAIVFVVYLLITQTNRLSTKYLYILIITFLLIYNFQLASRSSILLIYLLGFCSIIYWIILKRKVLQGVSLLIGTLLFLGIFIHYSPKTMERFRSITNTEFDIKNTNPEYNFSQKNETSNWNGVTLRLAMWSSASSIISENPIIGVGTGDYKSELMKSYTNNGFNYGIDHNYGIHNLYLYLLISFGFVGLVIWGLGIGYLISYSYKEKLYLFLFFLVLVIVSGLTENIFNRFMGVFLFTYFGSFLIFGNNNT